MTDTPRWRTGRKTDRPLSIIIPVLHEGRTINRTIARLRRLNTASPPEIIISDGDPARSTLRSLARTDVETVTAPRGRGVQMNAGARTARGEVLLFLHADVRLPAGAPAKIAAVLKRPGVAAGAFSLGIDAPQQRFRLIEKAVSIRGRLTRIPYGDQAVFMYRSLFFQLGGFREIPLMEDVDLMRRVKKAGGRIVILPDRVQASARRWQQEGIVYTTLRNGTLLTLYLLGVSPGRLARFYP